MAGIEAGSVFVRLGSVFDRKGFEQFEREHVRAQKAKDIATRLGGNFDASDFKRYEEQLDKVQKRVSKRDAFKATLGGDYNAAAFRAYERDIRKAERDTVQSTAKMRTAFGTVWGRGGAAFAAAGGAYAVVAAVKSITSAYQESETSAARMQTQLKALGISYDAHAKQIDNVIQKTSQLAGLDDEDLQDAFTNIIRVTGDVNKSLRLTGLAADLARAKHMDVAKAGELVGKVAGGNVSILRRYGIQIDKSATSTEALAELQRKVAGQAEAYGKTQAGASDRVQVAWENLREQLGEKLAPTFTKVGNKLADFINEMQDGTGEGGRFADKLKDIAGWLKAAAGRVEDVGRFLSEHKDLVKAAATAWVAYKIAALGSIAASKAAGAAALLSGRSAAAGGAVGAAGRGAGAVGTGALGGPVGIGIAAAAFGALEIVMDKIERRSKTVAAGFKVAGDYAKQMVEQGKPEAIHKLAASIDDWGRKAGATGDEIHRLKDALADLEKAAERNVGGVGKALDKAAAHFADFRKTGSNNLHGLHTATADNMNFIKRTLGEDSEAGRKALVGNFRLSEQAIRDAMTDGKVTTRDGLREIRRLMKEELAVYGITGQKATDYLRTSGKGSGNESGGVGRAGGGWIGSPGMIGTDTVPAMLAPGEAVLNRHQQAVIEGMLGGGFLDNLFANVQTPHYFAAGGRVQPAVANLGSRLQQMFGLQVTSTTGGTHAPGSYHYQGLAEDLGGSSAAMSKASSYLMSSGAYRSLLEGIHKPGLSVKDGQTVPSSFWGGVWDQHADHIHIALRALGALGVGGPGISAPTVRGGGALGRVVQGVLSATTRGANSRLASVIGSLGGGDIAPAGVKGKTSGQYNKAQLAALWRRAGGPPNIANLMAAIALAESGGDPGIVNSIGASGLWQIHPGGKQYLNPLVNARTAVSKYRTQGLGAWEAYTNGSYRQYLSRGGRVLNFASGGRVPSLSAGGSSAQGITGGSGGTSLRIRGLKSLQEGRVSAYDRLTSQIEDDRKRYEQADRRYNQTDEVFVDPVTGALNQDAIEKRAGELASLVKIRQRILEKLERALTIARRVVKTYDTMLGRLSRSLQHAKAKDRSGIRGQITKYEGERSTWQGTVSDLGFDIGDAQLDIGDLEKEGSELRGTMPELSSDSGATDLGGDNADIAGAVSSPDADAIVAQIQAKFDASEKNLVSANQVIAAFSSPGDIGTGGSNAINAVRNESGAVGAQFAPAGSLPAASAPTVINNYNMPGAPNVLRAIGDAATAGQSLQPAVSSSVERLGI